MMNRILCSLDIGNSKLAAILAQIKNNKINILASETLPVRGLSKGLVSDSPSLVDCIKEIISKLNTNTRTKIKRILISINGDYVKNQNSFATVALSENSNRSVRLFDVDYLRRQAKLLGAGFDEEVLHEFPQLYILDDERFTFAPVGLSARKIKLNSFILSASGQFLCGIKSAVSQAGYEIQGLIYSGIASSYSVLSEEEKSKGVLLIDMGACFTSLLFFKDKILRDFKLLPFGGNDITQDIAKNLNLSWELAEDIKKTSLTLSAPESKYSDSLVIKQGSSYRALQLNEIYTAVKIRLEEFLNTIKEKVSSSPWKDKIESGIVGIGGTARLEGVLEKIESYTVVPVRLGFIRKVSPQNQFLSLDYAAAVGLIYYGLDTQTPLPNLRNYFEGKSPIHRIGNFARHLYQEYF